jgi:hypothetical protein
MYPVEVGLRIVSGRKRRPIGQGAAILRGTPLTQRGVVVLDLFGPHVTGFDSDGHKHDRAFTQAQSRLPMADPTLRRIDHRIVRSEGNDECARGRCVVRPESQEFETRWSTRRVAWFGLGQESKVECGSAFGTTLPTLRQGSRGDSVDDDVATECRDLISLNTSDGLDQRISDDEDATQSVA